MSMLCLPVRNLARGCVATAVLTVGSACSSPTTSPTAASPTVATSVTIAPSTLQAAVNDPSGARGRFVINPTVTFSASGISEASVKDVSFAFVIGENDAFRQGAFLVHGGDLRAGPVTQQYPLTFDAPVHFPNLRIRMTATIVDGSGAATTTAPAEAAIQIPGVQP